MVEHLGRRPVLNMDDLAQMTDLRPRLEKELRLPGDKRGSKNRIYMFSVDGTLRGNRFTGCLLAGECIMVQTEKGFGDAMRIAKDGLNDTPEIARQYFDELARSLVIASPLEASTFNLEVGGGRAAANVAPGGELSSDPKLKALIRHKLGGAPWKF